MAKALYAAEETISQKEIKEVKRWHERIGIAKKSKDMWADSSGAKRFVDMYKGKFDLFFQGLKGKIPVPPINEVFAYVQGDIASTYNRDPYFTVNPKAGTQMGAALWESILNYEWRELQIKEEMELEIIDKDLVGSAWHKVGYAINSIGTDDKLKIKNEKLYSMRVDWKDVFWNVGARRPPKDCQWMAQRIVLPLDDMKRKYPRAKGLEGVPHPDMDQKSYDSRTYKDDVKMGVIYEIWDANERQINLIAEGLETRYLEEPRPWPEYLDEFPFLEYWDFWVPDSAYPLSSIAPWEPQILEEMVLLAQAINHSKRGNRQAFYNGGQIDDVAADKFERGDDGAMIRIAGKIGADDLRFVDYGPLPVDFYLLMDRLQAIKRNIHGQPEFTRGGTTKTGTRTVGELQLMEAGAKGRDERKIDRLETHLENIARHMMVHLKANFDFEQSVKITGDAPEEVIAALGDHYDPVTQRVQFTPEEIEGEYDVEVKAGSTLPMNKQTRTQIYETVLNAIAPAIAQGQASSPFMFALISGMLKDYDIKGLEEAYKAEVEQAQAAAEASQGEQDIDQIKTAAEAAKRQAQSKQIQAETEITEQEAMAGPVGRAQLEALKKGPALNGKNHE